MGLIQEVQDLKNTIRRQYNEKEVEALNSQLTANHLTKERKQILELTLYNDFNNQFSAFNENIYSIEEVERNILDVDNRNETCFRLAQQNNIAERYFIDTIYEKLYKKAKKRYILSQKAIEQYNYKLSEEEKIQKLKQLQEKEIKQIKVTNYIYFLSNLLFSPLTIIVFILILLILGYFKIALPIL